MTAVMIEQRTGRTLVSDQLFRTLTHRIVSDDSISPKLADRIMDQALAFLAACAEWWTGTCGRRRRSATPVRKATTAAPTPDGGTEHGSP